MSDTGRIEYNVMVSAFVGDHYHVKTTCGLHLVLHHGPAAVTLAKRYRKPRIDNGGVDSAKAETQGK